MADIALELAAIIIGLIAKYGVPAALAIIQQWNITEPTIEDLERLKEMVPPTEEYFKTPPETPTPLE